MFSVSNLITLVAILLTAQTVSSVLVRRYAGEIRYEQDLRLRVREVGVNAQSNCIPRPSSSSVFSLSMSASSSSEVLSSISSSSSSSVSSSSTSSTTPVTSSAPSKTSSSLSFSFSFYNPFDSESIPEITQTIV